MNMLSPSSDFVTERRPVMQGEARVSGDPRIEMTTVLGSCIASCLFDPIAQVGGMNHFLLSEPRFARSDQGVDEHYGVYLMEILINDMLRRGAIKSRLRAHLYGGANLHRGMSDIGAANAAFARRFLSAEGIALVREDVGGIQARRVDFRPAHGQARCRFVEAVAPPAPAPTRPARSLGDVELF